MIATVDLAQLGARRTVASLLRRPAVGNVAGLRWADVAVLAPLAMSGPPSLRRAGLLAFWDDEASAKEFAASHAVGQRFAADGFHATLRPLRAFGSWPGLTADIPSSRAVPHEGPVVVFTLGRLRVSQAVRFLRTSRPAERAAREADGMVWGTASARPPFVATISMWSDGKSAVTYAYGRSRPPHSDAIAEQQRKDFHKQSAFIRFAVIETSGDVPSLG